MKISDRRGTKGEMFRHLQMGTVFKGLHTNYFYIKTSGTKDNDGEVITNAVRLDNGLAHYFDDDVEVIKVDAELIIT